MLNKGRVTQMRKTTMLAVAVVALMLLGAASTFAAKGGGGGGMAGHAAAAPANFGGHSPGAGGHMIGRRNHLTDASQGCASTRKGPGDAVSLRHAIGDCRTLDRQL
jgi:hypothetical protein